MHSAMSAYSETDEEFFLVRTGHQCGRHTVTAPLPLNAPLPEILNFQKYQKPGRRW